MLRPGHLTGAATVGSFFTGQAWGGAPPGKRSGIFMPCEEWKKNAAEVCWHKIRAQIEEPSPQAIQSLLGQLKAG